MKEIITFSIPPQYVGKKRYVHPLSLNSRVHWSKRWKVDKEFKDIVIWTLKALRCPHMEKVKLLIDIQTTHLQDHDNAVASCKVLIDSLTIAKVIPDDDLGHLQLYVKQTKVGSKNDEKIILTIEEIT